MKMGSWDAALVIVGLLAVVCSSAADGHDDVQLLAADAKALSLQQVCLVSTVKKAVQDEFNKNNQITAGFLRVFFHDCMTDGCDASILLDGEWNGPFNSGSVQTRVRELVEEIRRKVHANCPSGTKASCADILALATRDSVVAAKGPFIPMTLGRRDSRAAGDSSRLPTPGQSIDSLLALFRSKGLDSAGDLVALSGGHTVGKTKFCGAVRPEFQRTCSNNGNQQVLDVVTPNLFDNGFFVALTRNQGVFASDQGLLGHRDTRGLVTRFAADQQAFFTQFVTSMLRLSNIKGAAATNGGVRADCTKPRLLTDDDTTTPQLEEDDDQQQQGFAASA